MLLPAALCLGACQKDTDPGPGGVTVGEARALDEAAEMLEKRPAPLPVPPLPAPPLPAPPLVDATVPADAAGPQASASAKP